MEQIQVMTMSETERKRIRRREYMRQYRQNPVNRQKDNDRERKKYKSLSHEQRNLKIERSKISAHATYKAHVERWYSEHTCHLCGTKRTQFHHIKQEQKRANLAHMYANYSERQIRAEIAKGIFLCKECHQNAHKGVHDEVLWALLAGQTQFKDITGITLGVAQYNEHTST